MDMHTEALDGLLTFLRAAERLKVVTRSAGTSEGQRESVAEHTCRMPRGCADGGT
jgi:putative hydrolases of HD superfamily